MTAPCVAASESMNWVDHLEELRRRILAFFLFFLAALGVMFWQGDILLRWIEVPAKGVISEFVFIRPTEAFMAYCQVVCLAAAIVAFPVFLYELWAFVSPAISARARRAVLVWVIFALISFAGGIVFAYSILLPSAFHFLVGFGEKIARPLISLSAYVSFAVVVVLSGGFMFEIPCLMGILAEAGIMSSARLRAGRKYAMVIIFILAAILTPTQDALNMIIFALPMTALYEIGILAVMLVEKRRGRR